MHRFAVKPSIYYAEGALGCLHLSGVERVLIIIDPFMRENQKDQPVRQLFGDQATFAYYTDIKPDPSLDLVVGGVEAALRFRPDLVVAIGGGSTLDEAKAIVFIYNQLAKGMSAAFKRPVFAAIPTTSGTGSEVTNVCVITQDGKKLLLVDDGFLPDIAVLDVEFTKTLPLAILADTSVDALTHALEAYISKNNSDCADAFAEKAVKLIFRYLGEIFTQGDNVQARLRLHNASCIAGMAFTNASLGIIHSMAHALGAVFHIPHGKANAVFLIRALAFNSSKGFVAEKLENLHTELGAHWHGTETEDGMLGAIRRLLEACGMPTCVKELGIDFELYKNHIGELVQHAMKDACTTTNPITPTIEDMVRLFICAYECCEQNRWTSPRISCKM